MNGTFKYSFPVWKLKWLYCPENICYQMER